MSAFAVLAFDEQNVEYWVSVIRQFGKLVCVSSWCSVAELK
jgi:hypothetical protein